MSEDKFKDIEIVGEVSLDLTDWRWLASAAHAAADQCGHVGCLKVVRKVQAIVDMIEKDMKERQRRQTERN